ncbi:MAG: MerR family transcriptional regulator [Cyanobacteria bacterium P01_C01_bin.70]
MSNLLQIGELAKQTGLSIRTLRYYDEIGLLVPSHRTEAEYRLYSEADIARLQQILSLRQLGFALKEIRECLENPEYSLPQVIDLHLARLQEQMAVSRSLFTQLSQLAQQLQISQSVAVEDLITTMETITMTQQYLTQEQHDLLESRLNQDQQAKLQQFLTQVQSYLAEGRDLNDPEVQQMAWQWREGLLSIVGGDLQFYEALMRLYQQEGAEAASWGRLDGPTMEYILKAVAMLSMREELSVREELVGFALGRLAPETYAVLTQGQAAMRELQLNFLGTEGLLLGLLAVEASVAAQALGEQGVDFATAETLIRDWLANQTVPPTDIPTEIPFTPRTYRVLKLAAKQAQQQGEGQITPQHLLLGILQEGEMGGGLAMHVLQTYGVDFDLLKQRLGAVII